MPTPRGQRRLSKPAAIALTAFAAGCGSSSAIRDTAYDASGCISVSEFSANIDSQLKSKVVGYVSTVGALATIVEYAKARMAADPPSLRMATTRHMNVARVSRVLTMIGVLQSLAAHNLRRQQDFGSRAVADG